MATPPDQLPEKLVTELARQYDVLRLLGRGGMGAVWLARERSLDRLVAIKVLSGEAVESSVVRERFRREARTAARLVHPNIVPLHAFGETPDALYFVMGYVEGETLAMRLERDGRIGKRETTRILSEIADALGFAHREGVVHRDVKPENILIDGKTGRALLADFGIARVENAGTSVTMTGMAMGTPMYMSPEQCAGGPIDGRSDLYSLGIVGYRMLAGRLPFAAEAALALMAQHATNTPSDLSTLVGPGEQGVAQIVMRALEKEPQARWPRAEDMRAELDVAARTGVSLPETLAHIQTVGTKLVAATAAVAGLFVVSSFWNPRWFSHPDTWMPILGSLVFFPAAIGLIAAVHSRKHGWRDTLKAMFNPPASWKHWWPRAWRRDDDLWDRLPRPLRRLRNVLDGVVTWLVADIVLFVALATTGGGSFGDAFLAFLRGLPDWLAPLTFGAPKALALGWVGLEFARTRRLLGISSREVGELLRATHLANDPTWNKPKYARLLADESEPPALPGAPRTPDELARAIAELSARAHAAGLLPDNESAGTAQSVRNAIAALDDEIRRLASEIDPGEGERLERRIANAAGDDDVRRLLQSQLELWQRLQTRIQEKERRRDRLKDQLRTLWMQLFELDARVTRGSPVDPDLTGQVRALCREIGHAGDALSEVERMTLPAEPRVVTPT